MEQMMKTNVTPEQIEKDIRSTSSIYGDQYSYTAKTKSGKDYVMSIVVSNPANINRLTCKNILIERIMEYYKER